MLGLFVVLLFIGSNAHMSLTEDEFTEAWKLFLSQQTQPKEIDHEHSLLDLLETDNLADILLFTIKILFVVINCVIFVLMIHFYRKIRLFNEKKLI